MPKSTWWLSWGTLWLALARGHFIDYCARGQCDVPGEFGDLYLRQGSRRVGAFDGFDLLDGLGIIEEYGDTYVGAVRGGEADGLGMKELALTGTPSDDELTGRGGIYYGHLRAGTLEGLGVFNSSSDTGSWAGEFADGRPHGLGIWTIPGVGEFVGQMFDGKADG